jgi:hypothetical protein
MLPSSTSSAGFRKQRNAWRKELHIYEQVQYFRLLHERKQQEYIRRKQACQTEMTLDRKIKIQVGLCLPC